MDFRTQTGSRTADSRRGKQQQIQAKLGQRHLWQLTVCLVLFLVVFAGKGFMPNHISQTGDRLLNMITADMDLRAVVTQLGRAIGNGGEGLLEGLDTFCAQVFSVGGEYEAPIAHRDTATVPSPDLLASELTFLSGTPENEQVSTHYLGAKSSALFVQSPRPQAEAVGEESVHEEKTAIPAAGTVLLYSNYTGDALPRNCTMDQISMGDLDYTAPVVGELNSAYGYRTHPISGDHLFHTGVDIDGNTGDPIVAFADGTVEYVGKDSSYGLYFQIDHGNGVKSFYAHCNSLCVTKGQAVAKGEVVAEVGSTGTVTGPHLHLELKFQRLRFDPAYYLEFSEPA